MEKITKKVICYDMQGREYEVDSGELTFRPSAYGVIIEGDKILLSKQYGGYDFPGGGVEIYESLEEAIRREVREETGVDVMVGKVVHCESSFFKYPHNMKCAHAILMYFLCEKVGGSLSKVNFDKYDKEYADLAEWVELKDINKLKFSNTADSKKIIQKALKILGR